jgi:hypothetical protein
MKLERWHLYALAAAVAVVVLGGGGVLAFVRLRQGDPRWGGKLLGQSDKTTIAGAGCLLTTLTMARNAFYGSTMTPDVANDLILQRGGFSGPNLLSGTGKPAEALGMVTPPNALLREQSSFAALGQLAGEILDRGGIPVIHVTYDGDFVGDHFLLVSKRLAGGNFEAVDPGGRQGTAGVLTLDSTLKGKGVNGVSTYVTVAVRAYYKKGSKRADEILAAKQAGKATMVA